MVPKDDENDDLAMTSLDDLYSEQNTNSTNHPLVKSTDQVVPKDSNTQKSYQTVPNSNPNDLQGQNTDAKPQSDQIVRVSAYGQKEEQARLTYGFEEIFDEKEWDSLPTAQNDHFKGKSIKYTS